MQTNGRIFRKTDANGNERWGVSYIDKNGKTKSIIFPMGTTKNQAIIELVHLVDDKKKSRKKWSFKKLLRTFNLFDILRRRK
jgi:hypothetical protein